MDGLSDFAKFGNLAALTDAAESAVDEELEAGRESARLLIAGLTFAARLADASSGRANATGLSALLEVVQTPETCIWVTALLVSLQRSAAHAESIAQLLHALSGMQVVEDQIRVIAAMSDPERAAALKGFATLRFSEQASLRRVIHEFQTRPEDGGGVGR